MKLGLTREKISVESVKVRKSMPDKIVGGYPYKNCGGIEIKTKEETVFYWVEINHILREDTTSYICRNCEKIFVKVIHHTEERY